MKLIYRIPKQKNADYFSSDRANTLFFTDSTHLKKYPKLNSWYKGWMRHRENDLPSFCANVIKKWFVNNELHRIGGPASIVYGKEENEFSWYLNGWQYDEKDYWEELKGREND